MVYRNKKQQETIKAGRLGAGFISVCFKTRWLGYLVVSMSRNLTAYHDLYES